LDQIRTKKLLCNVIDYEGVYKTQGVVPTYIVTCGGPDKASLSALVHWLHWGSATVQAVQLLPFPGCHVTTVLALA
jgi:hypothetical protein